jgi:hypothetical protein
MREEAVYRPQVFTSSPENKSQQDAHLRPATVWCVNMNHKLIEPVLYILGKPSKLLTRKADQQVGSIPICKKLGTSKEQPSDGLHMR